MNKKLASVPIILILLALSAVAGPARSASQAAPINRLFIPSILNPPAEPPLWMWGALFVPELVVFFASGWRLRTWPSVVAYAAAGATLREGFHYLLARAGEPGHIDALKDPFSDFAVKWPTILVAYVLVLALAGWSGRHEGRLIAGA